MEDCPDSKHATPKKADKGPSGVTLPPIDATPEEIAKALFRLKPEGERSTDE